MVVKPWNCFALCRKWSNVEKTCLTHYLLLRVKCKRCEYWVCRVMLVWLTFNAPLLPALSGVSKVICRATEASLVKPSCPSTSVNSMYQCVFDKTSHTLLIYFSPRKRKKSLFPFIFVGVCCILPRNVVASLEEWNSPAVPAPRLACGLFFSAKRRGESWCKYVPCMCASTWSPETRACLSVPAVAGEKIPNMHPEVSLHQSSSCRQSGSDPTHRDALSHSSVKQLCVCVRAKLNMNRCCY